VAPGVPILQNMPALVAAVARHGSIEPLLYEWATNHAVGGMVRWHVPGAPPVALVCDPDAVKSIFDGRWPKSPLYKDLEPLLGEQSLVLTEGAEWRAQRDAHNPAFAGAFLRSAFSGFCAATAELVAVLDAAARAGAQADAASSPPSSSPSSTPSPSSSPVVAPARAGGGGDPPGVVRVWEVVVLATVEIIFRVGFGEARGLLARPDRDPLGDPLYRAFYDLGTHVSWFLDNVPLNRLKRLPWNAAKTRRLRAELERQLGYVLDARVEAMRRSGALPAGVRLVDGGGGGGGGGDEAGAGEAAPASACPFAGMAAAGAAAAGEGSDGAGAPAATADAPAAAAGGGGGAADASTLREDDQMSLGGVGASTDRPPPPPGSNGDNKRQRQPPPADVLSATVAQLVASGARTLDRRALLSSQATLFAAGNDTTASAISWAVYYLSADPGRCAKLVAELDAVFAARGPQRKHAEEEEGEGGDGGGGGGDDDEVELPTWDELASMPYLTAVVKETLRVRPPVGVIARACPVPAPSSSAGGDGGGDPESAPRAADDPARGAVRGTDLRGTIAVVSPYVMHRLERYWGADAAEWKPERWLDNEGAPRAPGGPVCPARALSVPQHAYVPFSRGERDCVGSRFATIEAKVILAALFRRFDFEWAGSAGGERVRMALTAHPRERVPMRVRRRELGRRGQEGEEAAAAAAVEQQQQQQPQEAVAAR
jgi:cytochrome P450